MTDTESGKVSIVGVGSVGAAIAYACLIRGSAGSLALHDTNTAKVRAEVLDLAHAASSCRRVGPEPAGTGRRQRRDGAHADPNSSTSSRRTP